MEGFHKFERITESPLLVKAYEKAQEIAEESRINPEEFRDLYGAGVDSDLLYVRKMEERFHHTNGPETVLLKKQADVLEAIVFEHGEMSNWLGENAMTTMTSKYDDIHSHTDLIVEYQDEGGQTADYLGLALDVTYTHHLDKKAFVIQKDIAEGRLGRIKYFQTDRIRGELQNVPRVIAGAGAETLEELMTLWVHNKQKELANHPVQIKILQEAIMQCEAFAKYAERKKQQRIADQYTRDRIIIEDVLKQKLNAGMKMDGIDRDPVFQSIEALCRDAKHWS